MNNIYVKVIKVPAKEFDYYQKVLQFSEQIPDFDTNGVAETYTAKFDNGIEADIKVCNAEAESGGAYIDPVLFKLDKSRKFSYEVCVLEVADTLDGQYNFEYNGDEYQVIVVRGQ
jgi:hypothetical protein